MNLEKIFMRTKEQQEKEKLLIANLKNIDAKIKKEEKEERNLARLINNDLEEVKIPAQTKKVSGVMLLSNRFQAKLPISDTMQLQIQSVLQSMKIKPSELHFSQPVLEEFENLRELMLTYFSLDKYITERAEELGTVKEQHTELDTLKMVYEKSAQHLKLKNQQM